MTRTRPTMDDWRAARDLEWMDKHAADWLEQKLDGTWIVWAKNDPFDHDTEGEYGSLQEAIKVAKRLAGE